MRVIVLGAAGMLGHEVVRVLAQSGDLEVYGTCRRGVDLPAEYREFATIIEGVDAGDFSQLRATIAELEPDVVINCVGIVSQLDTSKLAVPTITLNSLLPHILEAACEDIGARLVHISTDCVFNGKAAFLRESASTDCLTRKCHAKISPLSSTFAGYLESDAPNATDLYGRSKLLGEVVNSASAVTLRTSIVGWQLGGSAAQTSLIGWFAAHRHEKSLQGYSKAIFSGLSTTLLAEVIRDHVLPANAPLWSGLAQTIESLGANSQDNTQQVKKTFSLEARNSKPTHDVAGIKHQPGLYHVSMAPIDKFTLLTTLAVSAGWDVNLTPNAELRVNKSLDSSRFQTVTGWIPPTWNTVIADLAAQY